MTWRLNDHLSAEENIKQSIPCIALPEPSLSMEQDSEWCVIRDEGQWQEIRFHDYEEIYMIPGLYERLFYDILKCNSPTTIRKLGQRWFLVRNAHAEEQISLLDPRWALSFLRGPMTRTELRSALDTNEGVPATLKRVADAAE